MNGKRQGPGRTPPGEHGRSRSPLGEGGAPVDPYLQWADLTNYAYLPGDPARLPILIKLRDGLTAKAFANKDWGGVQPPDDLETWLRIPTVYQTPPGGLDTLQYCTAVIERDSVGRLAQAPLTDVVAHFELSDPLGHTDMPFAMSPEQAATGWTPSVIVGVIDDGLPFANVRFRDTNNRTRVEFLWDQDHPTDLSKTKMDSILATCQHAGLVDEDKAYRLAGYHHAVTGHKSWARRATHGAHVMDLACGLALKDVAADSPHIVGVQLPGEVTADTSGVKLDVHVIMALIYILARADHVAAANGPNPLPVVVNLSYGINHGPHDGTSLLEQAIDAITVLRRTFWAPFTMVLAAGNSHLTRCHAHFQLAPGAARSLQWRVLPDDATPSFLDIWLPWDAGTNQVEVQVEAPDGTQLPPVQAGDPPLVWPSESVPWLTVSYPGAPLFGARNSIRVSLLPTTALRSAVEVAPSGTWRIRVINVGSTSLWIDAWILRDDTPFGYPIRGRQSRYEDALYERFDSQGRLSEVDIGPSYVRRDGSCNGIATGSHTAVIGGCRRSDLAAARYSAGGPTLKPSAGQSPPRLGPDATAFAEWSVACRGMLATGTRSGSIVAVNGTSVSAPQVTRWVADRMAQGAASDRMAVAAEGANHPTPNIPAKRGNHGYVDPMYSPIEVER